MLFVMMVTALTAWADDWTVNINPVALTPRDTVYVKNVGTGRYIGGGEAWGTQAVVNPLTSAAKCVIVALDDGTYQIKNDAAGWLRSGTTNENILYRQPNDGTLGSGVKGCYVDYSSAWSKAASQWAVNNVGNNVYTFQVPNLEAYQLTEESTAADSLTGYIAGEYLGVNRSHKSEYTDGGITWGLYYDVVYADSAANCQFIFLPVAITNAKAKLLQLVENASAASIDVTAAAALLANADATVEDVTAEANRLSEEIEQAATPTNPQDLTSKYISNPTPIAKGTPDGWTVCYRDGSSASTGDTSDGVGEVWNDGGVILKYTINQLPAGVYRFTAIALTRTGMYAKFFVNNDSVNVATVASDKVNNRSGAATWFTQDEDEDGVLNGTNVISLVLPETADVTIGLMSDTLTSDYWMVWREFKLESLGTGMESFQYISKDLLKQIQAIKDDATAQYTASIMDNAYTYATAGVKATTKAEAVENYTKAKAFYDDLKLNILAWKTLADVAASAEEESWQLANNEALQAACVEANHMISDLAASTDEVNAMITNIKQALDEARKSSYTAGDDVTILITNPTFNDETKDATYAQPQSTTGWIGASGIGSGWITDTRLAEVYDQDCDIHQDLMGLKKGAYRLSIQAFYRPAGASSANYQAYLNGDSLTQAYIYMGLTQQRVKSIYAHTFPESITSMSRENHWVNVGSDEAAYVPNTMDEAYVCFNGSYDGEQDAAYDNNYRNVVYGVVTENGGTMPIGFKIENHASTSWVVFRDFRLEYLGNDPVYIQPVLENKINEAKTDYLGKKMIAADKTAIDNAVAAGEAALTANDGDAMMDAFTAIADAEAAAETSISAYEQLAASYDSLTAQYDAYSDKASQDVLTKAQTLINEVKDMLNNGTIDVADIPAKQEEMKTVRKALMMLSGSDDEPANFTSWIKNPTYGSATGWTVDKTSGDGTPGIQYNTMEIWNATADVYQDIYDLPEGTYEVKVQSLFRPVSADEAWADLLGDSIENYGERASIYANWDAITPSYWCSKYDPDKYSWTTGIYVDMNDTLSVTETDTTFVTYHFANTRQAAEYQFQMNYYPVQSFYTYVGSDGHLRLGFKNTEHKVQDWFVVSNWELYYYGANSSHASATGISDINNSDDAKISEVYTVDGRRVNGLQKGLNIVRAKTANGQIVTKKIVVK